VVVLANHKALGLPYNTPIRTFVGDARNVVDSLPADAKYDFFFGDAFNDFSIPWHLTTLEFSLKLKAHMKPDGAYLQNVIDNFDTALFLGAYYVTLKRIFKHVYVFCTDEKGVQDRRDTFIIAAGDVPLDVSDWGPGHTQESFDGSALTPQNLAELEVKCGRMVLTDDFAPVENLLAPVVRTRKH
jgi:spermidine synthase